MPVAGPRILVLEHELGWHVAYLVSLLLDILPLLKMSHTMCTGTGEYITRSGLARALGKAFEVLEPINSDEDVDPHAIIQKVLIHEFWSELKPAFFRRRQLIFCFLGC